MKHLLPLLLVCTFTATARAGNIDLSTVPDRDTVQLTIYNAEDLTLVRETRKVVFKEGANPLQFSWAGTLIDPTSVQLRFLTDPDKLAVLDTTFPHDRPQVLYWNVGSELAGEATVEISYFTSGISWQADYTVIAAPDEATAKIEGYVTVSNQSGEDYEDAEVRLVVGTINLVEKIAMLAQQAGMLVGDARGGEMRGMRNEAARQLMDADSGAFSMSEAADAPMASARPKDIVKQGLSEYFIFRIEGTETIPAGLRKRMPSFTADAAPLAVQYRYRPREYGNQIVRMYLLTNDEEADLGTSPLPDGQVSVFRRKGSGGASGGGLAFLGKQSINYIPIGDKIELNLGNDPDVGFTLVTERVFRDNIWVHWNSGRIVQKVGDGDIKIDVNADVIGWDEHAVMRRAVRNDTPRPIEVEVRESFNGDVTFISRLDAERFDNNTVEYTLSLEPGEKTDATYETVTRQGRNHEQSRVLIEDAGPATASHLQP